MSGTNGSLWAPEIRPAVQSPWMILQTQAEALGEQTAGVLVGELRRRENEERKVMLTLDIVVPALNDYRPRVLVAVHGKDLLYPVTVDAEVFRPSGLEAIRSAVLQPQLLLGGETKKPENRADSDTEL